MIPNACILKVERLTKNYRTAAGPLTVLREVSFDLAAGASLAIVGPSGSGKTTLLGLCAGLDRATGGVHQTWRLGMRPSLDRSAYMMLW